MQRNTEHKYWGKMCGQRDGKKGEERGRDKREGRGTCGSVTQDCVVAHLVESSTE
jgi:hypothetical protein